MVRLSLLYALLDGADQIGRPHLEAALALWSYAEASARYIFGDALGDPVADELLAALRGRPAGLTRTEISGHFGRHRRAEEIGRALTALLATMPSMRCSLPWRRRTGLGSAILT